MVGELAAARSETQGKPWRPTGHPVFRGNMRSLTSSQYHYILNGDGVEELYDIVGDPYGQVDLVGAQLPETERLLRQFRTLMGELGVDE